jgi:hypothetical protein
VARNGDLTVQILRDIRDELRKTRFGDANGDGHHVACGSARRREEAAPRLVLSRPTTTHPRVMLDARRAA